MQTKAENISELLDSPFATVKNFNVGIVIIGMYILMDFGSISGLFPFLNYTLRLPFIIASVSILYAIYLVLTRRANFKSPTTKIFTIMCLFIILYAAIATKTPIERIGVIKVFSFYLAMYLIFISSVKSISQFILIIDIWLASVAFSSYNGIFQGGLVWGNKWLADENEIALLAAMAVPFALILFLGYKSKIKKTCYLICLVLYITVSVVGYSRGGMLSMAGSAFFCWVLLKKKVRMLFLMIIALFLIINFAPTIYFGEMATLQSGTEESTAEARIYFWKKGFEMLYDNPFFGVGPQNYPYFFPIYEKGERYLEQRMRVAHSFPVQWIAEMGIVGFGILLILQLYLFQNWRFLKIYKNEYGLAEEDDIFLYKDINNACAISLIVFWIGSLFLSLMLYPFFWFLVYFSESWKNIVLEHIADEEKK